MGLISAGSSFTYLLTCPSSVLTRLMGSSGVSVTVEGATAAAGAIADDAATAAADTAVGATVFTVAVETGTEKSKTLDRIVT